MAHRITKKINQTLHARKRFAERHGIELTKELRREMIRAIQNGKATFVYRETLRVTGWLVEVAGKQVKVLYDNKRHNIVTVLGDEMEWHKEQAT